MTPQEFDLIKDLVKDRPIDEKPSDPRSCPYCGSSNVKIPEGEYIISTLLGWDPSEGPDKDPNHHWYPLHCAGCNRKSMRQTRRGQVWYTKFDEHHLLRGIPGCWETCTFSCAHCPTGLVRYHPKRGGEHSYQCDNCKQKVVLPPE